MRRVRSADRLDSGAGVGVRPGRRAQPCDGDAIRDFNGSSVNSPPGVTQRTGLSCQAIRADAICARAFGARLKQGPLGPFKRENDV